MNRSVKYFLYYFSGLFSQIALMKIPCTNICKVIANINKEDRPKKQKKKYTINTNLHKELIDMNFKRVLRNIDDANSKNVNDYISYLQHFHDHTITEQEINEILKQIQTIKYSVKRDFLYFSHHYEKEILNQIRSTQYFYVKRNDDIIILGY